MSLFNNWFNKKTTATGGDPVLDALVSISSDDPYAYVSPSNLRNSDVFTAINIIASDIASNPVLCDTDVTNKEMTTVLMTRWTAFTSSTLWLPICY